MLTTSSRSMVILRSTIRLVLFCLLLVLAVAVGLAATLLLRGWIAGEDLRLGLATVVFLAVMAFGMRLARRTSVERTKKRWLLATPGWIGLAVFGCYVLGRAVSPWEAVQCFHDDAIEQTTPTGNLTELRVGAYNIAHGRGTATSNYDGGDRAARRTRLEEIARLIRRQDLDLVVLNEVDFDSHWSGRVNQAELIARAAGFSYWVEQRNLDVRLPLYSLRFGNVVLSKYPISDARLIDYPGYAWWETLAAGKKQGVVCTINLPRGRHARVLAVHLEHRGEAVRVAAVPRIERLRQEDGPPLIAAGDFNSTRLGFPAACVDANGQTALSLLVDGGGFTTLPKKPPPKQQLTFSSTAPRTMIDWILVAKPWILADVRTIESELSDHRPVIGTVRFEGL